MDGTFDLECAQWDRPVLAVSHHRRHGTRVHDTLDSLVDELSSVGGTWWSHNGGGYDTLATLEVLRRRGQSMSISVPGGRVTRASGGGLTLCDSYALIPLGLERAAELAGRKATELGWDCSCGRSCGGYCGITTSLSRAKRRELADYCVNDTEVAMAALDALQGHAEALDYDLRGTIGGSAWATAKRVLGLPDAEYPSSQWRRIRSAYHGGRCSVFRPRVRGRGRHWDLTAAYPSALASLSVPVGNPTEYGSDDARKCLRRERPGVYACTVSVPESHVPLLPWQWSGGVAYPIGPVSGVWPLPELLAAVADGATIDAVHWCVVWPREEVLFDDLMSAWTGNRMKVGKDTAWGRWEREFAASLSGKLAESPERRFCRMHPPVADIKLCLGFNPCKPKRCTGACGAYRQIDRWGELFSVPYYRQAKSGHIQWATYLTAATRVTLRRAAADQGADLAYVDTDSLWTTSATAPHPIGDGLGCWERKPGWEDWECVGLKQYAYTDDSGGRIIKAAGVRVTPEEWRLGQATQDRGVEPFMIAAAGSDGLFRRRHEQWTLPHRAMESGWYGDRKLDDRTGLTHPVTCEALRKRQGTEEGHRTGPSQGVQTASKETGR